MVTPYYHDEAAGITIYCGDARGIVPALETASVDLVLTDPPYGYQQSSQRRAKRSKHDPGRDGNFVQIVGDDVPFDPAPLLRFPRVALFGANHFADRLPPSPSWIVWDKRNGSAPDDNADAELVWTNLGGTIRTYRQCWRGVAREDDALDPHKHVHPTQKPVKMMLWFLERYTRPGDLVLDPYMGSGPIAQACHLSGRRYIGIEIEERYCEIAVRRLQQSVLPLYEVA